MLAVQRCSVVLEIEDRKGWPVTEQTPARAQTEHDLLPFAHRWAFAGLYRSSRSYQFTLEICVRKSSHDHVIDGRVFSLFFQ